MTWQPSVSLGRYCRPRSPELRFRRLKPEHLHDIVLLAQLDRELRRPMRERSDKLNRCRRPTRTGDAEVRLANLVRAR